MFQKLEDFLLLSQLTTGQAHLIGPGMPPRSIAPALVGKKLEEGSSRVKSSTTNLRTGEGQRLTRTHGSAQWNGWEKNGKTGELGQDRLEVRWEAVMFLFNVVNLNV